MGTFFITWLLAGSVFISFHVDEYTKIYKELETAVNYDTWMWTNCLIGMFMFPVIICIKCWIRWKRWRK